jgi:GT2 family glycosyltransferase
MVLNLFPSIQLPRSKEPRVSVIIPAKSKPEFLGACLHSLSRFGSDRIPCEIIVVLNETNPELETALRDRVKGIEVVASPVNLGLAGAGNRGRSSARGEFLVMLHDDAEIEPGWLEPLIETAETHPEAGAVGSKVLFPDGRLQNAGMILWRDAITSPPWFGEPPAPTAFDRLRAVDYCGTSSLLVRTAAWDAVGGLDERFYPAYYVDVDLSMALRRLGLVVLYQPRSRIRHHRGASTSVRFRTFIAQRNRLLFIEKWGTALEEYDPPERVSPVAIERALARAEDFASQCRRKKIRAIQPLIDSIRFDPVLQERRHFEKSRTLQNAYMIHLVKIIDQAEAQVDSLKSSWSWWITFPLRWVSSILRS